MLIHNFSPSVHSRFLFNIINFHFFRSTIFRYRNVICVFRFFRRFFSLALVCLYVVFISNVMKEKKCEKFYGIIDRHTHTFPFIWITGKKGTKIYPSECVCAYALLITVVPQCWNLLCFLLVSLTSWFHLYPT